MKKSNKVKLIGSILLIINILLILFHLEKNVEISKYNYECIYLFIPICLFEGLLLGACVCLVPQSSNSMGHHGQ